MPLIEENENYARTVRQAELTQVLRHMSPSPLRVLEIGAGNGWHSYLIAQQGHHVQAVDIAPWQDSKFPVMAYDGRRLPFADNSFDLVFSSSVLEHIPDITFTLQEIKRVLAPGGKALHILPTPTWRVLTTLTYYPALPWIISAVLQQLRGQARNYVTSSPDPASTQTPKRQRPWARMLKWIITMALSPRHGERGNRLTEAWYYRRQWWWNLFVANDFQIIESKDLEIVYSGNIMLGPRLSLSARRRLAKWLGSSSRLFVLGVKKER